MGVAVERGDPVTMGLLERVRRSLHRMAESDEQRLAEEIEEWASTIPGTTRIVDAPMRSRTRIAGVVRRITVRPVEGYESLEALISDGTGDIEVVWMGRRTIPGLSLGTRIVVDGVVGESRGMVRMVNPTFEFSR